MLVAKLADGFKFELVEKVEHSKKHRPALATTQKKVQSGDTAEPKQNRRSGRPRGNAIAEYKTTDKTGTPVDLVPAKRDDVIRMVLQVAS